MANTVVAGLVKSFNSMPGPRGLPIFGSALNYSFLGEHSFDRLHLAKLENYGKFGKIYRERLGPAVNIVQVFDPQDAEVAFRHDGKCPLRPPIPITVVAHKKDKLALGLGSLNGEQWYNLRKPVHHLMMHPRAAAAYLPAQNGAADDFLNLITSSLDDSGEVPDFSEVILKYTMESIGTVCFNTRLGVLVNNIEENCEAHRMFTASTTMFDAVQKTTFAFPWYALFRTSLYKDFLQGKRTCNSIALKLINQAREVQGMKSSMEGPEGEPHFLSSLLATDLKVEDVVGLTTDLFTAGIDSTANALCFVIYNLARNPEKQQILADDICRVLPVGSAVTSSAIDSMSYLKACVKESFRLNFPIEGGTTRILQSDLVLGGYKLPKKTIVAFNNQTMCLQEEYFENCTEFLPERWLKDVCVVQKPPPPFVMMPFGHGPRMCIGRRFAEQEIYLALIKILQKFHVEYHHEPIGMLNRVFTVPDRPLRIKFIKRQTS